MIGREWRLRISIMVSKIYEYDHGLPFNQKLAENLDDLKRRVLVNNKAALVIIDGGVGEGKTTLGVEVCDYLHERPIIFKEQLGMGGIDFLNKMKSSFAQDYHVVCYDEAGDFNRRGAIGRFNAMMNRVFETYRAFKIVVVLTLPKFYVLDGSLFDKEIPRMLLHCQSRSNTYGTFKAYSLYQMHWLMYWSQKMVVKSKCFERVFPNFMGHFLDLPPARCKVLDKFTISGKLDILDIAQIKHEGLINVKELSQKLGRSYQWTQRAVKALKVKEIKTYKNSKYYDHGLLERLMEVIGK